MPSKNSTLAFVLLIIMGVLFFMMSGWWKMLGLVPALMFMGLYDSGTPGQKRKKTPLPESGRDLMYRVFPSDADSLVPNCGYIDVCCRAPIQWRGHYADFTDGITDFGYHAHTSIYRPLRVIEIDPSTHNPVSESAVKDTHH